MKALRSLLFTITGYLLRLCLLAFITSIVFVTVLGSSKYVKLSLVRANTYTRVVPALIDTNKNNKEANASINYSDPKIIEIFNSSFPARDLQYNAELVIDSLYAWLQGNTKTLNFNADFSRNKILLADNLSNYAFNRIATLPACKTLPESVNPLTIPCKPIGYETPEIKNAYRDQLLQDDSFLNKTTFTAQDLPKSTDGKPLLEKFSYAPTLYKWLMRTPYITGGMLALLSLAYIYTGPRKRRAIASLGAIVSSAGVGLVFLPLIFNYALPYLTKSLNIGSGGAATGQLFNDITNQLANRIDRSLLLCGGAAALFGGLLFILERFTRPTSRYTNVAKRAGVASSEKPAASPKSLKNKLNTTNVPLQSSDQPRKTSTKDSRLGRKYRTLYKKKGF